MDELAQFHFLRPLWLLLLPVVIGLHFWLGKRYQQHTGFEQWIDAELLTHLQKDSVQKGMIQTQQPWFYHLLAILGCIAIIAIAGPVWQKQPQPLHQSERALVIILDLSPSMMANDNKPSRLVRARLKIQDILQQRKDGLTALIVYGGEAHVVTPLTQDTKTIANLLSSLEPGILPIPGSNIEMAIEAAQQLLNDAAIAEGDFLIVTDGITQDAEPFIKNAINNNGLFILGVGTPQGAPIPNGNSDQGQFLRDKQGNLISAARNDNILNNIAQTAKGFYLPLQADDSDIQFITKQLEKKSRLEKLKNTQQEDKKAFSNDQWHETGPTLLLLILPFFALLFRRGWLLCACIIAPITFPETGHASTWSWDKLWKNNNQQGQQDFNKKDYAAAQEHFNDYQWKGSAAYRNKDYQAAIDAFSQGEMAVDDYNRGNALGQLGKIDEAIVAYQSALAKDPSLEDAAKNKQLLEQLKKQQQNQENNSQSSKEQKNSTKNKEEQKNKKKQKEEQRNSASTEIDNTEENKERESQKNQEKKSKNDTQTAQQQESTPQEQAKLEKQANTEIKPLNTEEQQALEQWIRKIPDDPSGLLRRKFNYEYQKRRQLYQAGKWTLPDNEAHLRY